MNRSSVLFISLMMLMPAMVMSQVPQTLSYQGLLRSGGSPIPDGEYTLLFRLYLDEVGGTPMWTETHNNVSVSNGSFSVVLGSLTSLSGVDFNQQLFLGVKKESDPEFSPRAPLTSAASALAPWSAHGTAISYVRGAVGIGTSSPLSDLHIESSNPFSTDIRIYNSSAEGDPTISFLTNGVFRYTLGVDNSDEDKLQISIGSTLDASELLTLTSQGRLGLGSTSPQAPLHVRGAVGDEVARFHAPPVTASPYISLWYNTFEGARIQTVNDVSDGGSLRLFTAAPPFGTVYERMRIASSGNVGIGTMSPSEKLEVSGNVKIGNATIRSGAGTPEGVVVGNVGDLYLRTDGGVGSTMYVKESGSGTSAGWAAK